MRAAERAARTENLTLRDGGTSAAPGAVLRRIARIKVIRRFSKRRRIDLASRKSRRDNLPLHPNAGP